MDRPSPYFSDTNGEGEKALLVGVYATRREFHQEESSIEELARLTGTAGAAVGSRLLQELRSVQSATFIGKGAVEQIAERVRTEKFDLVIFDEDLSPTQNRNLEKLFGVKVIDRTGLILDIFARRARTREGKLQVESAQLRYLLPRLTGRGKEFSQLAGGIGTRGPGETRLEMDRRKAKERLALVNRELKRVLAHRELHRSKRGETPMAIVSLVGYTNAGKSTLLNKLTDAGVLVEDKLFATLDPTVRRLKLPSGREVLVSDTVGFVRKLPHQLIDSFRATFEEVAASDLLLHIIDLSHPHYQDQMRVVEEVLRELDLNQKPVINVYNKGDIAAPIENNEIVISALKGEGIDQLLQAIEARLAESFRLVSLRLPYKAGAELSLLYRTSRILKREDRADGIYLQAEVDQKHFNKFNSYVTDESR